MIDCDLSVPTMPCSTYYNGNISHASQYLSTTRPKGWQEEIEKLQDLSANANRLEKMDRKVFQVRFRQISPGVVLPQQVKSLCFSYENVSFCRLYCMQMKTLCLVIERQFISC